MIILGLIGALYSVTESVISTKVFAVTVGVRQDSSISCLLTKIIGKMIASENGCMF